MTRTLEVGQRWVTTGGLGRTIKAKLGRDADPEQSITYVNSRGQIFGADRKAFEMWIGKKGAKVANRV